MPRKQYRFPRKYFAAENKENRTHRSDTYELIYGPVANDDIYLTFHLYAAGELTKEETINRLKVKKLYNQLVFSSERAIMYLQFTGTLDKKGGHT